jgi:hypothetical protein
VPELLRLGLLLDGSSWFLEDFKKVWKQQPLRHSINGGGTHSSSSNYDRKTPAGMARMHAESAAREDLVAIRSDA